MEIKATKSTCAGVIFVLLGIAAFLKSQTYPIGTVTDMGAGYIPAVIGLLLTIFGLAAIVRARAIGNHEAVGTVDVGSLAAIVAGVVLFALSIERIGLAVGVAILVACTCYRRILSHPLEVLITYLVLLAIAVSLFIYGLALPLHIFRLNF
jgi:hypothetical protein